MKPEIDEENLQLELWSVEKDSAKLNWFGTNEKSKDYDCGGFTNAKAYAFYYKRKIKVKNNV